MADSNPNPEPDPAEAASAADPLPDDGRPPHAAEAAVEAAAAAADALGVDAARALDLPSFDPSPGGGAETGIGLLSDVDLHVKIELGRTRMLVEDVLRLDTDSVIELDKAAGDPVDVYVNGRLVARGEVLVVNENFCVRVSEIMSPGADGTEDPGDDPGAGTGTAAAAAAAPDDATPPTT